MAIINNKNFYKWILCATVFLAVVFFSVFLSRQNTLKVEDKNFEASNVRYVEIGGQKLQVDLALTEAQQEQGLSGRDSLDAQQGMLFVFGAPGKYMFWMKDMNFPIDMIWLNQNLNVIYIKKDAEPSSYPSTFGPNQDAKYVLEVPNGFADKNDLQIGDSAQLLAQ